MKKFFLLTFPILAMLFAPLSGCKKVNVNDTVIVESITLSDPEISLLVGQTTQLIATIHPREAAGREITWYSSNQNVATVADGLVTAKSLGKATISAKAGSHTATCEVEVVPEPVPLQNLMVEPQQGAVKIGGTLQMTVRYSPTNTTQRKVTWSSSNDEILTVDENGLVTGKKAGWAYVNCISKDHPSIKDMVTVNVVEPFTSIRLETPDLEQGFVLDVDQTCQLVATAAPATSEDKLVWEITSGSQYATVDQDGLLTGVRACPTSETVTVTVRSMANPSVSNHCQIRVYDKVTDLILVPASGSWGWESNPALKRRPTEYIGAGQTQQLKILIMPSTAYQSRTVSKSGFAAGGANFTNNLSSTNNNVLTITAPTSRISKKDTEYSGSVYLSCRSGSSSFTKTFKFIVCEFDPYRPKPGDALYVYQSGSGSSKTVKLYCVDCGYRGRGIQENHIGGAPSGSAFSKYASVGYIGNKHIEDDPDFSAEGLGIDGICTGNGTGTMGFGSKVHGVGIPINTSAVWWVTGPVVYGDEKYWESYSVNGGERGEKYSYEKDDMPSDVYIATTNTDKMTAYHNTVVLAGVNDRRGSSHAIKPIIYSGLSSSSGKNYLRYNYGASTANYININMPQQTKVSSPWIIPTQADMQMIFHGSLFTGTVEDDEAAARIRHYEGNSNKNFYAHSYWLSQASTSSALVFKVVTQDSVQSTAEPKDYVNQTLPIIYF